MIKFKTWFLTALMAIFSTLGFAAPPDFSSLTASVDYSTAISSILLVMASLVSVAIVWKGGKLILRALGMS